MIPFSIHQFFVHHAIGRAFGTLCRLSSVMFCIVAKRYVLAKNRHCLKEWIGNQGQKVDFLGHRHISTSGFASMATETAIFARTAQRSALDGTNGFSSSKGKCLFLPDYGPLGLGLVLRLGSMVGHPSNSWASLLQCTPSTNLQSFLVYNHSTCHSLRQHDPCISFLLPNVTEIIFFSLNISVFCKGMNGARQQ